MGTYLLKRLLQALPALWALATIVFLLSRLLPGTFGSERILQNSGGYYSKGTAADRQAAYQDYRKRTGQDLPLFYFSVAPATEPLVPKLRWHGSRNQYHRWLLGVLQGDLGRSYKSSQPVMKVMLEAVGNTFWLLACSMLVTFFLALELSIRMAGKRGGRLRKFLLPLLFVIDSIPPFVLALLLLVLLANPSFLQLFPVFGMGYYIPQELSLWEELVQWTYFMALPMLSLVLFNLPYLTSQMYDSVSTALRADYIRTARAKGLDGQTVIRRHALPNSLLPIITIVSDFIPALVTGTLIVETVFAVPGIGRLLIDAVLSRDYPVLTGIVLMIAVFRVVAYLLADLAYARADPRTRQQLI
ncbi:ABC transporter permease [Pontibacter russatus]|uniref:ABC transporter permease n=1 Tax=Pontibacter russatus TaxID=2694929 RepID=UPI00137AFA7B|nr:ABC transporter permease [Pontibacter russatus]